VTTSDILNREEFEVEYDNLYQNASQFLTRQLEKLKEETLNAMPES